MSAWSWLKRSLAGSTPIVALPTPRPHGWLPITPEEIEAVWADARVTVRAERRARLRRAMGRR